MQARTRGVGLILLSAASFGVLPVLTKVVYADGADVVGVLAVRFALAAGVLLVLARLRRERLPRGRSLALAAALGLGYVCQALLYFSALERISAGLTALLLYAYPALVVVLSAVLLRDRPARVSVACVAVASLGTAATVGPVQGGQLGGVALGLGAAVVYATYIVLSTQVGPVAPIALAATVLSGSAVIMGVVAGVTRPALPQHADAWAALVGVALVGTVVAVVAFFAALRLLGAPDTSALSTFEPVVSVGVAALVLGERLAPGQLLGGAVVLAAVVVLARQNPVPAVPGE